MATCSKCSSPSEWKEGVSKKTNKPYQGYRCTNQGCGNMDFQNAGFTPPRYPDQPKPQAPAAPREASPAGFSRKDALTLATRLLSAEVSALGGTVTPLRYRELINMVANAYNNKFEVDLNEL